MPMSVEARTGRRHGAATELGRVRRAVLRAARHDRNGAPPNVDTGAGLADEAVYGHGHRRRGKQQRFETIAGFEVGKHLRPSKDCHVPMTVSTTRIAIFRRTNHRAVRERRCRRRRRGQPEVVVRRRRNMRRGGLPSSRQGVVLELVPRVR